jgi:hypothetical protein
MPYSRERVLLTLLEAGHGLWVQWSADSCAQRQAANGWSSLSGDHAVSANCSAISLFSRCTVPLPPPTRTAAFSMPFPAVGVARFAVPEIEFSPCHSLCHENTYREVISSHKFHVRIDATAIKVSPD